MYTLFPTKKEAQDFSREAFNAPQGTETKYKYAIIESPVSELCACVTEDGLSEEEFYQREDFWGITENYEMELETMA